jgi:hypothetical protein
MSDLSDLHGVFPTSFRWNSEEGFSSVSTYNLETGEREQRPIVFGREATFAMDLLTRERGYGLIRVGVYDMRFTPVGTPAPPWPEDEDFKPALGCWLWNPQLGELRLETNASIFRNAVAAVWDDALRDSKSAEGLQPVIRFDGKAPVFIKSLNKTFQAPIDWLPRDQIPGWSNRPPTVPPPKPLPLLTQAKPPPPKKGAKGGKPPSGDPPIDEIPFA